MSGRNGRQPELLDRMYLRWQQASANLEAQLELLQRQARIVEAAQREALVEEARFKGAIEARGAEAWEWDGEHVILTTS